MSETKVCKRCGKTFPATAEYFYKNPRTRDGLRGECKQCKNALSTTYDSKRRAKGLHLRHDLVCEWCRKDFKADIKSRKFCSRKCQHAWMRESGQYQRNIDKAVAGLTPIRAKRFIKRFEKIYPQFKYHSGYTGCEDSFKCQCRVCGYVQERSAQVARPSREGHNLVCDNCIALDRARARVLDVLRQKLTTEERAEQLDLDRHIREEIAAQQRIANNHRHYLECEECGRMFFRSRKRLTCSERCSKKRSNRIRYLRRNEKLKANGAICWDISVERLSERDGGTCHLCGQPVDFGDYEIREDGTWICGEGYPSIDHIMPVSKGGTHTWDNIKLAHRGCNATRGDDHLYEVDDGQLRFVM